MAITEFNLQQKAIANIPFIETYGIDLLNKMLYIYMSTANSWRNIVRQKVKLKT